MDTLIYHGEIENGDFPDSCVRCGAGGTALTRIVLTTSIPVVGGPFQSQDVELPMCAEHVNAPLVSLNYPGVREFTEEGIIVKNVSAEIRGGPAAASRIPASATARARRTGTAPPAHCARRTGGTIARAPASLSAVHHRLHRRRDSGWSGHWRNCHARGPQGQGPTPESGSPSSAAARRSAGSGTAGPKRWRSATPWFR